GPRLSHPSSATGMATGKMLTGYRLHLLPLLLLLLGAAAAHLGEAVAAEPEEKLAAEAESPVEENLLEPADEAEADNLEALELLDDPDLYDLSPEEQVQLQQKWFRFRLPRIRLPRIRLPRIRLPRIRLPRIRLPRIRLPRIRLPRIRLPRIRLPRIRLRLPKIRRIFRKLNVFHHLKKTLSKLKRVVRRKVHLEHMLAPIISQANEALVNILNGLESQAGQIVETQKIVRDLATTLKQLRRAAVSA
ncbi:hypothetical protein BOX15_Mlig030454g1, partial [Macrostomum lignano]